VPTPETKRVQLAALRTEYAEQEAEAAEADIANGMATLDVSLTLEDDVLEVGLDRLAAQEP
jgi:hypothetical protein